MIISSEVISGDIRREDIGVPWRYAEWYDNSKHPYTYINVDGNKEAASRPRLLDNRGRPVQRYVHRIGFQAGMVIDG